MCMGMSRTAVKQACLAVMFLVGWDAVKSEGSTGCLMRWCSAFGRSGRITNLLLLPQEDAQNLKLLTEGVHSREALEVVKDHVKNVMGPAAIAYSNTVLKMSKLQAAQV